MDLNACGRMLQDFLSGSCDAVVIEDGSVLFDLRHSKYSISGEYGKCLLHLWSGERNIVRRVLDADVSNDVLQIHVQRLGQAKPSKLEICRQRDRRTPTAKRAARSAYQAKLRRAIERRFSGFTIASLSSGVDLERSFGPIYARGLIRRGQTSYAVLGVNDQEAQSSIDAALTFGILWLDTCRASQAGRAVVEGLKLFIPRGSSQLTRERIAHLEADAAKWQLYEFDQREDVLHEIDIADRGNMMTRLVHATDESAARERFSESVTRVQQLMPEVEIAVLSPAEIAFRCHGLEFARARFADTPGLTTSQEIVFGVGAEERVLSETNAEAFVSTVCAVGEARHAEGPRDHPFWRLHPERWLESLVVNNVAALDERLNPACLYSQVPAFSASDRAMLDVLTTTREGRLVVVELKADEDIHLPLQGLDYWSRVVWHQDRGEFRRFGYFPGRELSSEKALLLLVAPALHVHPATDTLLRYVSKDIDWTLLGIDERWREGVRVLFRKRPAQTISNCQLAIAN